MGIPALEAGDGYAELRPGAPYVRRDPEALGVSVVQYEEALHAESLR